MLVFLRAAQKEVPSLPTDISDECRNFLERLLDKDPSSRLGSNGAREVKSHPFFEVRLLAATGRGNIGASGKQVRVEVLITFPGLSKKNKSSKYGFFGCMILTLFVFNYCNTSNNA